MIANETVKERVQIPLTADTLSAARIAYLEGLVQSGQIAAAVFTQFTQEDVDRIVKPMVLAGLEQAQHLARLAVEETRLGVMEDKVIKNMVASEFVYNYVKDKRTVGVIREVPRAQSDRNGGADRRALLAHADYQSRRPRFCSSASSRSRRGTRSFSVRIPKAWRCCSEAVRIMYEAAVKHGAPEGVFTCVESPTLPDNAYLMRHKDVGSDRRHWRTGRGKSCLQFGQTRAWA